MKGPLSGAISEKTNSQTKKKKKKVFILSLKLTRLPHLGIIRVSSKHPSDTCFRLINACHRVQFKLDKRSKMLILSSKIPHLPHLEQNKEF